LELSIKRVEGEMAMVAAGTACQPLAGGVLIKNCGKSENA